MKYIRLLYIVAVKVHANIHKGNRRKKGNGIESDTYKKVIYDRVDDSDVKAAATSQIAERAGSSGWIRKRKGRKICMM